MFTIFDTVSFFGPLLTSPLRPGPLLEQVTTYFQKGAFSDRWQVLNHNLLWQYATRYMILQASFEGTQQGWGIFNPTRKKEISAWEIEQFRQQEVLAQAEAHLQRAATALADGGPTPDDINVVVMMGDPANRALMVGNHGLSGFGGAPGEIFVTLFPSAGNLARLGAVLTRLYVHNIFWHRRSFDPLPTLADFLMVEGQAFRAIEVLYPEFADTPWLTPFTAPPDHEATLGWIAGRSGVNSYNELRTNVFGSMLSGDDVPTPPRGEPLTEDELAYSIAVVREGLTVTEWPLIAAYLYGDEIVGAMGHPTVGLSPYAGFEVAYRDSWRDDL